MSRSIKLKKGLDIRIVGAAEKVIGENANPVRYGVKPVDFPGLIPRLTVKPGDKVLSGATLFHDKIRPEISFSSPVSGTVVSVERGDRRKMLEVTIEKSGENYADFGKSDPAGLWGKRYYQNCLNQDSGPQ